jgi:hypothetical protein
MSRRKTESESEQCFSRRNQWRSSAVLAFATSRFRMFAAPGTDADKSGLTEHDLPVGVIHGIVDV